MLSTLKPPISLGTAALPGAGNLLLRSPFEQIFKSLAVETSHVGFPCTGNRSAIPAGLVLGAIMLTVTVRFVEGMLYGVSAFAPGRLAVITGVLALTTIGASLFPALRAASIDPIQALRSE